MCDGRNISHTLGAIPNRERPTAFSPHTLLYPRDSNPGCAPLPALCARSPRIRSNEGHLGNLFCFGQAMAFSLSKHADIPKIRVLVVGDSGMDTSVPTSLCRFMKAKELASRPWCIGCVTLAGCPTQGGRWAATLMCWCVAVDLCHETAY